MVDENCPCVELLSGSDGLNHRLDLSLQVVALVDHIGDVGSGLRFPLEHFDFVEDSENLVGIDRTEGQVVVRVTPVIEMKPSHHFLVEEPRDDLFDVLRLVVMSGIDKNKGLGTGFLRQ